MSYEIYELYELTNLIADQGVRDCGGRGSGGERPYASSTTPCCLDVVSSTAEMKELIVIDWLENIICPINC